RSRPYRRAHDRRQAAGRDPERAARADGRRPAARRPERGLRGPRARRRDPPAAPPPPHRRLPPLDRGKPPPGPPRAGKPPCPPGPASWWGAGGRGGSGEAEAAGVEGALGPLVRPARHRAVRLLLHLHAVLVRAPLVRVARRVPGAQAGIVTAPRGNNQAVTA